MSDQSSKTSAAGPAASTRPATRPDLLTLVAVSILAYVLEVALHEHGGHALACVLVHGQPRELGAFYVDCDYAHVSDAGMRLVALAGPLLSLATGLAGFALLKRLPAASATSRYFLWLLASLGLMSASGYLLFSGVAGIGDLGTTRDGALYQMEPAWLWRAALTAAGAITYWGVIKHMRQTLRMQMGAEMGTEMSADRAAMKSARRTTLISYLSGAIAYAAIGLLNPHGFVIMAVSVLPSSLGGTCGLVVMWNGYRRSASPPDTADTSAATSAANAGLIIERSIAWIAAAAVVTIAYAALFGPTLYG